MIEADRREADGWVVWSLTPPVFWGAVRKTIASIEAELGLEVASFHDVVRVNIREGQIVFAYLADVRADPSVEGIATEPKQLYAVVNTVNSRLFDITDDLEDAGTTARDISGVVCGLPILRDYRLEVKGR